MSENFTWDFDGRTVEFKRFADIPLGVFRDISRRQLGDMDAMFVLFDKACTPEDLEFLDTLPLGAFDGFVTIWSTSSAVSLPES